MLSNCGRNSRPDADIPPRVTVVVIAEYAECRDAPAREARKNAVQLSHFASVRAALFPRHEVAGYHDDVGRLRLHLLEGAREIPVVHVAADVNVTELRESDAIERRGKIRDSEIALHQLEPVWLDDRRISGEPGAAREESRAGADESAPLQLSECGGERSR